MSRKNSAVVTPLRATTPEPWRLAIAANISRTHALMADACRARMGQDMTLGLVAAGKYRSTPACWRHVGKGNAWSLSLPVQCLSEVAIRHPRRHKHVQRGSGTKSQNHTHRVAVAVRGGGDRRTSLGPEALLSREVIPYRHRYIYARAAPETSIPQLTALPMLLLLPAERPAIRRPRPLGHVYGRGVR